MSQFTAYNLENSTGEAKEILAEVEGKYGFIPNLFSYMAEAPTTIKAYIQLNQLLDECSIETPQLQVALLAASIENKCDFCAIAHRAIGKSMGANPDSLNSLNKGEKIADAKDQAIADMVVKIIQKNGWVEEEEINAFLAAGYTKQQYLELILVVTIKTLSNFTNHVTKPEPNPELLGML